MNPALLIGAGVVALGSLAAFLIPSKRRAQEQPTASRGPATSISRRHRRTCLRAGLSRLRQGQPRRVPVLRLLQRAARAVADAREEERKVVTVLFCDVVGFTSTSGEGRSRGRAGPYAAVLRAAAPRSRPSVEVVEVHRRRRHGRLRRPRCARGRRRARRPGGLRILEAMRAQRHEDPTGSISASESASTRARSSSTWCRPGGGEAAVHRRRVNAAARIQRRRPWTASPSGSDLTGRPSGSSTTSRSDAVDVKGKQAPVAVWRRSRPGLVSAATCAHRDAAGRARRERRSFGPLRARRSRRPVQLVTIVGEPGVGKAATRLGAPDVIEERPGSHRVAAGPMPAVRGRDRVLGARRGRKGGRRDPRERHARCGRGKARSSRGARRGGSVAPRPPGDARRRRGRRERSQAESFTAWRRFLEGDRRRASRGLRVRGSALGRSALLDFLQHVAEWSEGVAWSSSAGPSGVLDRYAGVGRRHSQRHDDQPHSAPATETAELIAALLDQTFLPVGACARSSTGRRQPALRRGVRPHA